MLCVFSAICYEAEDLPLRNDRGNTLLSDLVVTQKEASRFPSHQHQFLYRSLLSLKPLSQQVQPHSGFEIWRQWDSVGRVLLWERQRYEPADLGARGNAEISPGLRV